MLSIAYLKKIFRKKPRIIVILGQTATGKSALAVSLAEQLNGEVISADSRQVYQELNLSSGKISEEEMCGIPHHMLDVAHLDTPYSVADYVKAADDCIQDILKRNKLPIICGGSGFYIEALVEGQVFEHIEIDTHYHKELGKLKTASLYTELLKKDPTRAKEVGEYNRQRILRSLLLIQAHGKMPRIKKSHPYAPLYIGLKLPQQELEHNIWDRIIQRLDQGMIEEIETLKKQGVSSERLEGLGLECRSINRYLEKKEDLEHMIESLYLDTLAFAKRQATWFKRNKKISWYHPKDQKFIKKELQKLLR